MTEHYSSIMGSGATDRVPQDSISSLHCVVHTAHLVSVANLLRVPSIPLSFSLTNSTDPNTSTSGTPLLTGLQVDIEPLTSTL